ncbi:MAG: DUF2891 family protein [Pirellulales bacterium]
MRTLYARLTIHFLVALSFFVGSTACGQSSLNDAQASSLAQLALKGIQQEYPNKPSNVLTSTASLQSPKAMHPAFYGCFDWHSSVHGHWMLVRLLKTNPNHSHVERSRQLLREQLTLPNCQIEADYFLEKENRSFERMYGWAWLLRLVAELHQWDDSEGKQWRQNLVPLETKIVELVENYLPRLSHPIRTGVHPDTAFALGQIYDYAQIVGQTKLTTLLRENGLRYYAQDQNYNDAFEPSGEDFFSTSLNEADFMRRILPPQQFQDWLEKFLPSLANDTSRLLSPVAVTDVSDGKLVHLAGLDLSRAWTLKGIASSLAPKHPWRERLLRSAIAHDTMGMQYVFSGKYEGEHWLGTFATYSLTLAGQFPSNTNAPLVAATTAIVPSPVYAAKPDDPRFEKFFPRKGESSAEFALRKGDRLAVIGDSITEQKMYSRIIETYLLACNPQLELDIRQLGWSGERLDGFLKRMDQDCLRFQPTVATLCYGMNDSRYRPYDDGNGVLYQKLLEQILDRFQNQGVRTIVGSPGCAGKIATWVKSRTGTLDEHNLHLCALRDIALRTAQERKLPFADIFWPMYQSQILAPDRYASADRPYEVAGKDGVHPGWAGQVIMAHAFLKSMRLDGNLASFTWDAADNKLTCSEGHTIQSQQSSTFLIQSTRYPFCADGPLDRDDSMRSGMTLVPFHHDLNRFQLSIAQPKAKQYRVQWGEYQQVFDAETLLKGINLPEAFPQNPFSTNFEKVSAAVLAKQSFETQQIKQIFRSPKAKENFEAIVAETEKERQRLVDAVKAAVTPVQHSLTLTPVD